MNLSLHSKTRLAFVNVLQVSLLMKQLNNVPDVMILVHYVTILQISAWLVLQVPIESIIINV